MHNKQIQVILLFLGILVIFGGITALTTERTDTHTQSSASEQHRTEESPAAAYITLTVDGIYDGRNVFIDVGDTVLDVLTTLDETDPELDLTLETHDGLGALVTAMGDRVNGTDNRYWQYTVDGEMPMIGAGNYELEGGETIEWTFTASAF